MSIDIERVVGTELPESERSWSADDVILYHLGLGAGDPPTDSDELRYVFERDLRVLPSYGVIPSLPAVSSMLRMPGVDIDLAALLHGEQELEVHGEIPTACSTRTKARVTDVFDKGEAALVVIEAVTSSDGKPLFTNRFRGFIRGEGGFGGEPGPKTGHRPPDREPDRVVERLTLPQQALLYRLSGDRNPLHADPDLARRGGFDRPILHGLCSFGIACKAVVDTTLGGDTAAVAAYDARFAGVIFPGETLSVSIWDQGDRVYLSAAAAERDEPVLTNAAITRR